MSSLNVRVKSNIKPSTSISLEILQIDRRNRSQRSNGSFLKLKPNGLLDLGNIGFPAPLVEC